MGSAALFKINSGSLLFITANYAALLALFYIGLSCWVVRQRWGQRVGLGDGGKPPLRRAIRIQGNFGEYVPFCLVLMLLLESMDFNPDCIHGLGITLVTARGFHLWGLAKSSGTSVGRFVGTCLTFLVMLTASIAILLHKA
jgi:uncharacterized membrane protein YecN with MAPEG domain